MDKNVNPWTGKSKTSRTTGLFNDLLYKHYPELERQPAPNPYLDLLPIITSQTNPKHIEEYREFFDLKTKISKIEQILEWIDNIEHQHSHKKVEEEIPISSSFVYIPVHSYNTFHELLKECSGGVREPVMKEETVGTLKSEIREMN
jgi:hypothetical protein